MEEMIVLFFDSIRQVFRQSLEYKRGRQVSGSVPIRQNNRDIGVTTDCISLIAGKVDGVINSDKPQPCLRASDSVIKIDDTDP